jgi:hypothetical protein
MISRGGPIARPRQHRYRCLVLSRTSHFAKSRRQALSRLRFSNSATMCVHGKR